jgi:exodeoxyribonuclease V gamma subunit
VLRGAFELPQRGDRPATGAVTLSALEPMRSVPFRVIAVLGLDDRAFPRVSRPPAWDPFAKKRPGEHDRRTIDRHLFLESVLCARDALLLFGNGFEQKRGDRAPMSVVVSELAELCEAALGLEAGAFVVSHPLQPWSEAAFVETEASPRGARASAVRSVRPALSYDTAWVASALARRREVRAPAGLAATQPGATMPPDDSSQSSLDALVLAKALSKPQEELLKRRLGLSLAMGEQALADREPLELDTLEGYELREQALALLGRGGGVDLTAWEARLSGEGRLPMRSGGRRVLATARDEAAGVLAKLSALGAPVAVGRSRSRRTWAVCCSERPCRSFVEATTGSRSAGPRRWHR